MEMQFLSRLSVMDLPYKTTDPHEISLVASLQDAGLIVAKTYLTIGSKFRVEALVELVTETGLFVLNLQKRS